MFEVNYLYSDVNYTPLKLMNKYYQNGIIYRLVYLLMDIKLPFW